MLEIQNRTCVRFKRVEENHPNFVYIIKPSFVGIEDACLSMVGMTGKNSISQFFLELYWGESWVGRIGAAEIQVESGLSRPEPESPYFRGSRVFKKT